MDSDVLRAMGEDWLARMLVRRPDIARPAPGSLAEVLRRMPAPDGVWVALRRLNRPTLQVAEATMAMGNAADRTTLLNMIGRHDEATAAAVDRAFAELVEHGLAVRDGVVHIVVPTLDYLISYPLGLAEPATQYLASLSSRRLATIADKLGVADELGAAVREDDAVEVVLAALSEHERMTAILAQAPPSIRDQLRELAVRGGALLNPHASYGYAIPRPGPEVEWALDRGLLMPVDDWQRFVMPGEVAMALRGPGYHVPFDPVEPYLPRAAVDATTVTRDALASAAALLRLATRLVDEAGRGGVAGLRSGGVGVRELRRLAKANGCGVGDVRLALALLHHAGLTVLTATGIAATDLGEAWLGDEPPQRLAVLVRAWWSLPDSPLLTVEDKWEPVPHDGAELIAVRNVMLALFAREPGAPTDHESTVEVVGWRKPLLLDSTGLGLGEAVAAWRAEAALLGVLGAGAVSEVGRALLNRDAAALEHALSGVGESVRTAHLQADLAAIVAGTPDPALSDLLTALAERDKTGSASTWRFSAETIRHAMDTGWSADEILNRLEAVAAAGVPQTLAYLVSDVARRHGSLRASEVACCIRGEETTLLAEVAADRRLRDLQLRLLAPTVLASAAGRAETLAALRRAGYAPLAESADGSTILEPKAARRTVAGRAPRPRSGDRPGPDPATSAVSVDEACALARTLFGRPEEAAGDDGPARPPGPPRPPHRPRGGPRRRRP